MAIAEDASAPAAVNSATATATTASFTPAAGSLLVAVAVCGNNTGSGAMTAPVTDSLASVWTLLKRASAGNGGSAEVWALDAGASPAARTVTVTGTGGVQAVGTALCVKVLTGALPAATCLGASGTVLGTTAYTIALTSTVTGSLVCGGLVDVVTAGALTVNGVTTAWQSVSDAGNTEKYAAWRATSLTGVPGSGTYGYTNTAANSQNIVAVEVLAAAVGGGGPQPQPGGRAWRRLYRRPQTAWQVPAVTAAAVPVRAVQRPAIISRPASRARIGGRGLCAAGILATGIGPPAVPAPHQPPAIAHPAPHRAQWHGGRGAVPAAVPQPARPVMVYRRAPHRAQWVRPQPGSPPAAVPQPFKPGTVYARSPHRALWRGGAGSPVPVVQGGALQPSRPVTVWRRTPHGALWRTVRGAPPAALPQPSRPVIVWSRPQHRVLWRGGAGPAVTITPALGTPQPFRPATVYRRIAHGALWRTVTGKPPAAAAQPSRPATVFRRAPHRAAWQQARGAAPAARRQPFTPATIWARTVHRALWRAITGPPAPPSAAVQNATSSAAVTAQVTSGPAVTAVTGSAAAVTDPRDGTAAVTTGGTYDPYLDAYTDSYPGFRGAASTAAVTQPGTSQPGVSGG